MGNTLYYGDNLVVLKQHIKDESVDLVYLDPPFNSNQTYNTFFQSRDGGTCTAQIKAFEDTWTWDEGAAETLRELLEAGGEVAKVMECFRVLLGKNTMLAYLSMMAPRLMELRRVLKPTGSLYLHCDPGASHYLKLLMDAIFTPQNYVNEIIWKRSSAHSDTKQGARHYGRVTDTLLFYSKGDDRKWNPLYTSYDEQYVKRDYRRVDPDGRRYRIDNLQGPGGAAKGNPFYEVMGVKRYWRYSKERMHALIEQGRVVQSRPGAVPQYKRYLDEMPGVPAQNLWSDIPIINNRSKEKLGYPTQKPLALLERIIQSSSNAGDVVLDPFCGCGTAVDAAQTLRRQWIGIDITHLAVGIIKRRLHVTHGLEANRDYAVLGEPTTLEGATILATKDTHQFEHWALGLVYARGSAKDKGADGGIDGWFDFYVGPGDDSHGRVIISVKAGKNLGVAMVRELGHVVSREKASIGVLIVMHEPTKPMLTEAADAGHFTATGWDTRHRRLQILTVKDLFAGKEIDAPPTKRKPVKVCVAPSPRSRAS